MSEYSLIRFLTILLVFFVNRFTSQSAQNKEFQLCCDFSGFSKNEQNSHAHANKLKAEKSARKQCGNRLDNFASPFYLTLSGLSQGPRFDIIFFTLPNLYHPCQRDLVREFSISYKFSETAQRHQTLRTNVELVLLSIIYLLCFANYLNQ